MLTYITLKYIYTYICIHRCNIYNAKIYIHLYLLSTYIHIYLLSTLQYVPQICFILRHVSYSYCDFDEWQGNHTCLILVPVEQARGSRASRPWSNVGALMCTPNSSMFSWVCSMLQYSVRFSMLECGSSSIAWSSASNRRSFLSSQQPWTVSLTTQMQRSSMTSSPSLTKSSVSLR